MFDNLKSFFFENLIIPYKEYLINKKKSTLGLSKDLKFALNLASALYHVREHFPENIRKSRSEIAKICPDYNLLADVVNAYKHKSLTQGNRQLSDVKNIYEIVIGTLYLDSEGEYNHIEKTIELKLDNGTERDLHEVIINVLNMWIVEFKKLNIIEDFRLIPIPSKKIHRRSKKSGIINLVTKRNLTFTPKFKLQRYNYEKKTIEPVDLTGNELKLRVYKPMHTISLTAIKDNEELVIEIGVDEKQLKLYQKFETDEERLKFFLATAKEQGKIE